MNEAEIEAAYTSRCYHPVYAEMRKNDPRLVGEILFSILSGAEVNLCALALLTGNYIIFVSTVFPALMAIWSVWTPSKTLFELCSAVHWLTTVILIATLFWAHSTGNKLSPGSQMVAALAIAVGPFLGAASLACSRVCGPNGFCHWEELDLRPATETRDIENGLGEELPDHGLELPESVLCSERLSEVQENLPDASASVRVFPLHSSPKRPSVPGEDMTAIYCQPIYKQDGDRASEGPRADYADANGHLREAGKSPRSGPAESGIGKGRYAKGFTHFDNTDLDRNNRPRVL